MLSVGFGNHPNKQQPEQIRTAKNRMCGHTCIACWRLLWFCFGCLNYRLERFLIMTSHQFFTESVRILKQIAPSSGCHERVISYLQSAIGLPEAAGQSAIAHITKSSYRGSYFYSYAVSLVQRIRSNQHDRVLSFLRSFVSPCPGSLSSEDPKASPEE